MQIFEKVFQPFYLKYDDEEVKLIKTQEEMDEMLSLTENHFDSYGYIGKIPAFCNAPSWCPTLQYLLRVEELNYLCHEHQVSAKACGCLDISDYCDNCNGRLKTNYDGTYCMMCNW